MKSPENGSHGSPPVAHHFDDWAQHASAASLGMWLFLVTEVMFFGGLFTAYMVYRNQSPEAFAAASQHLDVTLGTANTVILLASSFTMALAVWATHERRRGLTMLMLAATMALGAAFLVIKGIEYGHKFEDELAPLAGWPFHFDGPEPDRAKLFFGLYFAMTGVHALHMVIGLGALGILFWMAWRGRFESGNYLPVEMTGLYWHFVDVIWIFLFPLLYLIQPV